MNLRDTMLEAVKRPAIRVLHASPRGEAAILRVYLEGEEHAERAVLLDPVTNDAPDWLQKWLVKHRADEARHAEMLRARIVELTGDATRGTGNMDPVSRWKMRRLARLARAYAPKFREGLLVPILATASRMEAMAARVFARHVDVLRAKNKKRSSPTLPVLEKILKDERGHVTMCERALARLVAAPEWNDLQMLVLKIDRIERAFGVLGAFVLLSLGVFLWAAQPFSTSRSPTPAGT
jgi:hypothetical protein